MDFTDDQNDNVLTETRYSDLAGTQLQGTSQYGYDGNQLTSIVQTNGSGNTLALYGHRYEAAGQLSSETDNAAATTTTLYDAAGRLTLTTWYSSTGVVSNTIQYTYDQDGNLLSVSNNVGTVSMAYDPDGQVTSETETSGLTLSLAYDGDGNVTQVLDSQGGTLLSTYDADDNLSTRSLSGSGIDSLALALTYTADDQLSTVSRTANGSDAGSSSYTYNADGLITQIVHEDADANTLGNYQYSYNSDGLVSSATLDGVTTDYTYNADNELIAANTQTYNYDAAGNPDNAGDTPGQGNELLSDGTWNYSYDANGNLTGKTGVANGSEAGYSWTYQYNDGNQLISAVEKQNGTTIASETYQYDGLGERVGTTVGSTTTQYAYLPSGVTGGNLYATLDSSGAVESRYVYGDQQNQVFGSDSASNGINWLLTDNQGSVKVVTNGTGSVLDKIVYDAYGNITSQTNASAMGIIGYTGSQYDVTTGLVFDNARYYNPQTEQFISVDPIGFSSGTDNLYGYTGDDPVNGTDPTGNELLANGETTAGLVQQYFAGQSGPVLAGLGVSPKIDLEKIQLPSQRWLLEPVGEMGQSIAQLHNNFQAAFAIKEKPPALSLRSAEVVYQLVDALRSVNSYQVSQNQPPPLNAEEQQYRANLPRMMNASSSPTGAGRAGSGGNGMFGGSGGFGGGQPAGPTGLPDTFFTTLGPFIGADRKLFSLVVSPARLTQEEIHFINEEVELRQPERSEVANVLGELAKIWPLTIHYRPPGFLLGTSREQEGQETGLLIQEAIRHVLGGSQLRPNGNIEPVGRLTDSEVLAIHRNLSSLVEYADEYQVLNENPLPANGARRSELNSIVWGFLGEIAVASAAADARLKAFLEAQEDARLRQQRMPSAAERGRAVALLGLHLILSLGELIPIVQIPAGIANGTLYASEGDALGASLSFGSALPLVGYLFKAGKLLAGARAAANTVEEVNLARTLAKVPEAVKAGDAAVNVGKAVKEFDTPLVTLSQGALKNEAKIASTVPALQQTEKQALQTIRQEGQTALKDLAAAEPAVLKELPAAEQAAAKQLIGDAETVVQTAKAEAAGVGGIGNVGCFVAGTPTWVAVPQSAAVASDSAGGVSAMENEPAPATIPIEAVALGQRVPSRNPALDDAERVERPDCRGWKVIGMEVQHRSGALVDVQLLRPEEWIERHAVRVGVPVDLRLTDIDVDACADVVSITDGPEVEPGPGAVVTGRFVTRAGSGLVRVTFEDGTELVGTANHPVWSPMAGEWYGLGEFKPGELVQARSGLMAVASTEELPDRQPLYNIEIDGEHVYEVTPIGVVVHNSALFCEELLTLRAAKESGAVLSAAQTARLATLESRVLGRVLYSELAPEFTPKFLDALLKTAPKSQGTEMLSNLEFVFSTLQKTEGAEAANILKQVLNTNARQLYSVNYTRFDLLRDLATITDVTGFSQAVRRIVPTNLGKAQSLGNLFEIKAAADFQRRGWQVEEIGRDLFTVGGNLKTDIDIVVVIRGETYFYQLKNTKDAFEGLSPVQVYIGKVAGKGRPLESIRYLVPDGVLPSKPIIDYLTEKGIGIYGFPSLRLLNPKP